MVRQGQGEAEFPQKQLETAFLHSLRLMDQNREYLQMHLAPAADSRAAQALDDMAVESARLERTFREVMELSAPEQPLHKLPLDLCQLVSQMDRMGEEIKAQCGTTLRADCGGLTQCLVWGDRAMAEQICFHLLSNALHAVAPGGSITVGLSRTSPSSWRMTAVVCRRAKAGWKTAAAFWAGHRRGCCSAAGTAANWAGSLRFCPAARRGPARS